MANSYRTRDRVWLIDLLSAVTRLIETVSKARSRSELYIKTFPRLILSLLH